MNKYINDSEKVILDFSKEAIDLLMKYNYPGNIRELENIVHHSIVLSRNDLITSDDLPIGLKAQSSEKNMEACFKEGTTLTERVELLEKTMVDEALKKTNGNQSAAAKLGISERNLRYRLEKWGYKTKS